jgi:SAM-dependent methyltransferase
MAESRIPTIGRDHFQNRYSGKPPWDIGKPQPAFESIAEAITGAVLDAGCGTGEHALMLAGKGRAVTGFDFMDDAIVLAKRKAEARGLTATFLVKDALELEEWTERFDSAIDCGLFHVFSDEDRVLYVRGLKTVLKRGGRLFLMCFSDQTPGTEGPRRVTKKELRDTFGEGWEIESIEAAQFEVRPEAMMNMYQGQGPKAWFMVARRGAWDFFGEYTAEVTAATLYEAVAHGIAAIRGNEWVAGIAQGLNVVKVSVADVRIEHEVKVGDFTKWLERSGGSPREISDRQRIRTILGMRVGR